MRKYFAHSSVLILLALARGADCGAQETPRVPAAELVRQYFAGESKMALDVASACPADDPYQDEVFRGLLARSTLDRHEIELAGTWTLALSKCNDARITQWFHDRIRATADPYAAMALAWALAEAPTRENIEALKEGAFREDLSEDVRGQMLAFAADVGPMEQISWLLDGYRAGKAIPFPYLENRFFLGLKHVRAADVGRARRMTLDALESRPDHPRAGILIAMLLGDAVDDPDQAWRTRLREGLGRVAANPRANASVRSTAEGARAQLARVNR